MAKILNSFFTAILAFALVFCWVYYSTKISSLSVFTAAASAIVAAAVMWMVSKRVSKKQVKKNSAKTAYDFAAYLAYSTDSAELFKKLLTYKSYNVISVSEEYIVAEKSGDKYLCVLRFKFSPLSADETAAIFKTAKKSECTKCLLFTVSADKSAEDIFAERGAVLKIFDAGNTYKLFADADMLIDVPRVKKSARHFVLEYALNKRRFGWYFTSALFLLAVSAISYFPVYTLVWASVLAAVSVYCLVNKRFNYVPTDCDI